VKESRYNIWIDRDDGAYVYNGVSGTLLRIDVAERDALTRFLDGDDAHGLSSRVAADLVAGRMLVADDGDELAVLRSRYERSRFDTSSFGLTIVTSLGCNFDCPYCFEAKHPSILSPAVEASVLRVLDDQLPRIDDFHVTWFGGEPLVGKRPLLSLSDEFIARCEAASVDYGASIITNGYLLTADTCRELQERRVTSAQVGLDGPPEYHDRMRPLANGDPSFWRIVENLHHAVEHMEVVVASTSTATMSMASSRSCRSSPTKGSPGSWACTRDTSSVSPRTRPLRRRRMRPRTRVSPRPNSPSCHRSSRAKPHATASASRGSLSRAAHRALRCAPTNSSLAARVSCTSVGTRSDRRSK